MANQAVGFVRRRRATSIMARGIRSSDRPDRFTHLSSLPPQQQPCTGGVHDPQIADREGWPSGVSAWGRGPGRRRRAAATPPECAGDRVVGRVGPVSVALGRVLVEHGRTSPVGGSAIVAPRVTPEAVAISAAGHRSDAGSRRTAPAAPPPRPAGTPRSGHAARSGHRS